MWTYIYVYIRGCPLIMLHWLSWGVGLSKNWLRIFGVWLRVEGGPCKIWLRIFLFLSQFLYPNIAQILTKMTKFCYISTKFFGFQRRYWVDLRSNPSSFIVKTPNCACLNDKSNVWKTSSQGKLSLVSKCEKILVAFVETPGLWGSMKTLQTISWTK